MNLILAFSNYNFDHPFQFFLILIGLQFATLIPMPTLLRLENKFSDAMLAFLGIFCLGGFVAHGIVPNKDYEAFDTGRYLSPFFLITRKVGVFLTAVAFSFSFFGMVNKLLMAIGIVARSFGSSIDTIAQAGFGIGLMYILGSMFIPWLLFSFFFRSFK